ncbi:stage II sporulation protein M [Nocardioides marmoriginsengisoli]|uniref:Stage II sporulation protein M n=1 Tax=Nocardioides marmoriginsengisoli TaxID=661483 RepID=A0A3N0CCW5_9ACTN|nr:stage II sporulation protein M [Nocardioides marmoriginsengisoli]RNL61149.1 stage II sporulation protein M [Nocardioides marmoriginsengisoli]
MDLDAYVIAHRHEWERLEVLTRSRRLTGAEGDELVDRYQQVATHLSVVRTSAPDPQLVAYLSAILSRARNRSVGTRVTSWRNVVRYFTEVFPAALYRLRWWWLGTMAANVVVIAVMMLWLLEHPNAEQTLMSREAVDSLVNHDFADYYSNYAASEFALQVWINNAWVAALCLALGVLGVPVIYLLFTNIANVAVIGAIMTRHDHAMEFWGLLLPHGLLELTAVFVAAGVGLKLFWSWIEPGAQTRTQALAQNGRTAATVALGLVVVLMISGAIEGFVTPSGLPTWARLAIGIAAEVVFFTYVFTLGRNAYARGQTGDIDASLLEDRVATAS